MNEIFLYIGLGIGLVVGGIAGTVYDCWKVSKIVEYTILRYRVKEEEDRADRLRKFCQDLTEEE